MITKKDLAEQLNFLLSLDQYIDSDAEPDIDDNALLKALLYHEQSILIDMVKEFTKNDQYLLQSAKCIADGDVFDAGIMSKNQTKIKNTK